MAAAVKTQYATNAVYGSAAYDLDRVPGYAAPEGEAQTLPAPEELARERLEKRARERALERARAREAAKEQTFGVPLLAIAGGLAVAALMVLMLLGYVQLAAISGQTSSMRSSISKLEEQNEIIRMQYEATFNMDDIELYAVNILGMVKPETNGQSGYTVIIGDRAQILAEDETAGVLVRIKDFFRSLTEYFG